MTSVGGLSCGLILAAGSSRRLGSPKQLLPWNGTTLLGHVVNEVNASKLDQVVVILGGSADFIRSAVDFGRASVIVNPGHLSGMGSSLRFGMASLGPEVDRAVVILGDQPAVTADLFDRLLDLQSSSGLPAAALRFGDLSHPPVVLERSLWSGLESLEGDVGCRAVIRARPELVAPLAVDSASDHPVDVDTSEDYERLLRGEPGRRNDHGKPDEGA